MGDGDEVGKIFVGGLTRETSDEMLEKYFAPYGEIIEAIVMKDKMTGYSRGFGFVKFKEPKSVQDVLKARPHMLDNKKIDPKPCTPKGIQQQKKNAAMEHTQTHKIFIGGLAQNATEDEVRAYFTRFGGVSEVVFVINKEDNRHKGFGFVTFEEESSVVQAVEMHFHEICGKKVEAKRATPREKMNPGRQQGGADQSGDGYGAYGYGYGGQGQGGWMPPGQGGNGMMGYSYGYGQGYATAYPQGYGQSYYGYNYNPSMGYGGMGQMGPGGGKGDMSKGGYGGMGNYGQQSASGYGPTRGGGGQSYGSDYDNGYGRNGEGGGGRSNSQGYHPYKR